MEQNRAEDPVRAGHAARRSSVPAQNRRARAAQWAGDAPAARGEQACPSPAARTRQTGATQLPERYSVRAQILDALREALLSGELAPGEVYSAPAVADRFGVSATPVREAMQQLVSEGAVETVPNRGFRVAEYSARDYAELAEVRALLEIPAVLRAARSVPADSWDALRPLAEDALAAAARGDRAAYAAADQAFHGALLEPGGNSRLVAVAADIQRRAQRRPLQGGGQAQSATELLGEASEHVALLDALQAGDLALVERVLRTHLTP